MFGMVTADSNHSCSSKKSGHYSMVTLIMKKKIFFFLHTDITNYNNITKTCSFYILQLSGVTQGPRCNEIVKITLTNVE